MLLSLNSFLRTPLRNYHVFSIPVSSSTILFPLQSKSVAGGSDRGRISSVWCLLEVLHVSAQLILTKIHEVGPVTISFSQIRNLEYLEFQWLEDLHYLKKTLLICIIFRKTESTNRKGQREKERIPSSLHTVSAEPNAELKLGNRKIMTWAESLTRHPKDVHS